MIEAERCIHGKTSFERRFYISSLPADALRLAQAVLQHITLNLFELKLGCFVIACALGFVIA